MKDYFTDNISFLPYSKINTFDQRDWNILEHSSIAKSQNDITPFVKGFDILNQGNTNYCTSFATYNCFAHSLVGSHRNEFQKYHTNEIAFQIAKNQFSIIDDSFKQKVRRMFWIHNGYNARMALYNFNHGIRLPGGTEMQIKEYYRAYVKTPEELHDLIDNFGHVIVARTLGSKVPMFNVNGHFIGDHKLERGHLELAVQSNRKGRFFTILNQWGAGFGLRGHDTLDYDDFRTIKEVWVVPRRTKRGEINCIFKSA